MTYDAHSLPRLFISYRRDDSAGWTDRLYEALLREFSKESIFLDVDGTTPAGYSWVDWIDAQVAGCDIMLVLIGPRWGEEFTRRAGSGEPDNVRKEIERGLAHGIPVVPVRLGDTVLPVQNSLPASIRPLLDRQGLHLGRYNQFQADVETLIRAVTSSIGSSRKQRTRVGRPAVSPVLQTLERELLQASHMPADDVTLTVGALASYSDYLERGGSAGITGLAHVYDRVPDFSERVDAQKATSALNEWLDTVNRGESGQFGWADPLAELSDSWTYVDWKGDLIADRSTVVGIRVLRPAIFATGGTFSCYKTGRVLASIREGAVSNPPKSDA